ncbi:glycerophosphodiester phosphodiesterase [Agromyces mediolanus]|uniref:glycerophosphodiester phosphodiesterase family protein n=1 Tax=Agromyces mediolanus TaxID=41986 RepID=UPI00203C67F1|nr:glycerophosphodiester phosphodiesterase family protein [Agromyces mediolanus]MCM3656876.1 glycerophosphodiester phosphodiesterase [Agromyces mediolanus]
MSDDVTTAFFEGEPPRVLAHRGLALEAPENTLLAFAKAVAIGITHVETDVHVSHDGVAVIAHDPTLERVAARPVRVDQLTMPELRRVELGDGQGFASLVEALDGFAETRFNIDVKAEAAVAPTIEAVRRTRSEDRVLLTSFSERRRLRLARAIPGVATSAGGSGVLAARAAALSGNRTLLRRALRGARALQIPERASGITLVTPGFLRALHDVGVEVHVWTVNDPLDMRRLLALGVDGLVTDRADIARELIDEH